MSCLPWQSVQVAATMLPPLRAFACAVASYSLTAASWQPAQLAGFSLGACGSFSADTSLWQSVHLNCICPCTEPAKALASTAIDLPPSDFAAGSEWHIMQLSLGFGAGAAAAAGAGLASRDREKVKAASATRPGRRRDRRSFSMLSPRIESLGIQRRRAENAHQGALRGHGAGSVACDSRVPLIHVKANTALSPRSTGVSLASNEPVSSTASGRVRTRSKL